MKQHSHLSLIVGASATLLLCLGCALPSRQGGGLSGLSALGTQQTEQQRLEAEQPVPEIYAGSRQFDDESPQPQPATQIHYGASYSSDNELVGGVSVEHHVPPSKSDSLKPHGARPYAGYDTENAGAAPETHEAWDDSAMRPGEALRTAFSPTPRGYRNDAPLLVRGQSPGGFPVHQPPQRTAGIHQGMPDPNQPTTAGGATYYPAGYGVNQGYQPQPYTSGGQSVTAFQPAGSGVAGTPAQPANFQPPFVPDSPLVIPDTFEDLPIGIDLQETQTGRLMVGVGVNSDAGLVGNLVIDEQNFDLFRPSFRWADWVNGTAFRGAGQRFRIEAMPGTQVQRYSFSFQDPYFLDTAFSFGVSAFYFQRIYQDWNEGRLGGRLSLGYLFPERPDLSLSASIGAENVNISNPVVPTPSQIAEVVGNNELYTARLQLAHDTRDSSFLPTEGHFISLATEYGFGTFQFPRFEADFRQYFIMRQRPDGSGRHILGASAKVGVAGSDTPVFEHFFAGGFSTLRGFEFRGASPQQDGAIVGGEFQLLTSLEYRFPLTANDMLFGSFFVDAGTVEPNANLYADNFRITPGFELRISVPAMGPIPIAVGLGVPVAHAPGDEIQNFHFFVGVTR